MAKRTEDAAAAKAKKQKIVLIVGGVLLLAVAGIQVPKLMKGSSGPDTPAAAAPAAASPTQAPGAVAVVATPTAGAVVVAGVPLPRTAVAKPETSQLASFTLFEAKDPFVQQVSDQAASTEGASTTGSTTDTTSAGTPTPTASASSSGSSPAETKPPAPDPIVYATIDFNGKPQQLQVKETFPTPEPLFVLRSVAKKQAKISVAGGSFDGGAPVTLKLGKKVTLVNTATGVRYVLKLVYTGTQPEVIEGFTTGAPDASTAATGASSTTTDASTADAATATAAK